MTPLLVLTIGRSPRPDLVAELGDVLGPRPIEVRGALDDATVVSPIDGPDTLHTRFPDGTDVVVSKKHVTARLASLLEDVDGPVLVACTGRFQGLPERAGVLYPSTVLEGVVDAALPSGSRLGALVPLPEQVEAFAAQWGRADRPATVVAVKPGEDPTAAAAELTAAGVDLVVLDCFGYDRQLLDAVRRCTKKPVLSAVRVTAHIAVELLG